MIDEQLLEQAVDLWVKGKRLHEISDRLKISISSVWQAVRRYRTYGTPNHRFKKNRPGYESSKKEFSQYRIKHLVSKMLSRFRLSDYDLVIEAVESIVEVYKANPANILTYLSERNFEIKEETLEMDKQEAIEVAKLETIDLENEASIELQRQIHELEKVLVLEKAPIPIPTIQEPVVPSKNELDKYRLEYEEVVIPRKFDMNDRKFQFTALLEGESNNDVISMGVNHIGRNYEMPQCTVILNRMSDRKMEFYANKKSHEVEQAPTDYIDQRSKLRSRNQTKDVNHRFDLRNASNLCQTDNLQTKQTEPIKSETESETSINNESIYVDPTLTWWKNPVVVDKLEEIYLKNTYCSHADRMLLIDSYEMMDKDITEWFIERNNKTGRRCLYSEETTNKLLEQFRIKRKLSKFEQDRLALIVGLTTDQVRKWFYDACKKYPFQTAVETKNIVAQEKKEISSDANKSDRCAQIIAERQRNFKVYEDVYKNFKFLNGSRLASVASVTSMSQNYVTNWFSRRRKQDGELVRKVELNNKLSGKFFVLRSNSNSEAFIPKSVTPKKFPQTQTLKRYFGCKFSYETRMELQKSFDTNQFLDQNEFDRLHNTLDLTARQIRDWFKDHRFKERKKEYNSGVFYTPTSLRICKSNAEQIKSVESRVPQTRENEGRKVTYGGKSFVQKSRRVPKRNPLYFPESTVTEFLASFKKNPSGPSLEECERLKRLSNKTTRQIKNWFFRRRHSIKMRGERLASKESTTSRSVRKRVSNKVVNNQQHRSEKLPISDVECFASNESANKVICQKLSTGRYLPEVVAELEKVYCDNQNFPSDNECKRLFNKFRLTRQQIQKWFSSARFKNIKGNEDLCLTNTRTLKKQPMVPIKDRNGYYLPEVKLELEKSYAKSLNGHPSLDDLERLNGLFDLTAQQIKRWFTYERLGGHTGNKRCYSDDVLAELCKSYAKNPFLGRAEQDRLIRLLRLSGKQVVAWFYHRRIKTRMMKTEIKKEVIPINETAQTKVSKWSVDRNRKIDNCRRLIEGEAVRPPKRLTRSSHATSLSDSIKTEKLDYDEDMPSNDLVLENIEDQNKDCVLHKSIKKEMIFNNQTNRGEIERRLHTESSNYQNNSFYSNSCSNNASYQ